MVEMFGDCDAKGDHIDIVDVREDRLRGRGHPRIGQGGTSPR